MPDVYNLYGPGGASMLNIGSWVRADQPIDFGTAAMKKSVFVENVFSDGGRLAFEDYGVRRFSIPLILGGSYSIPSMGLAQTEGWIRRIARPGGYIDLMPQGVASGEAVRFDILNGQLVENYDVAQNRANIRTSSLLLDVNPLGYWPTWIFLATSASVGAPAPGVGFAINPASILGDVPAHSRLVIVPTYGPSVPAAPAAFVGNLVNDMVAWSVAGRPSFSAFLIPTRDPGLIAPIADAWSPGSTIASYSGATSGGFSNQPNTASITDQWFNVFLSAVSSGLEPDYRGRHRAYAFLKVTPSSGAVYQVAGDFVRGDANGPGFNAVDSEWSKRAMASANVVATMLPNCASGTGGASMAYQIIDLGEMDTPGGSQITGITFRVWMRGASVGANATVAGSQVLNYGGVFLLPVDGMAGIIPKGFAYPSTLNPAPANAFRIALNSELRTVFLEEQFGAIAPNIASPAPVRDFGHLHYGRFPLIGASTTRVDLLLGARLSINSASSVCPTAPLQWAGRLKAGVALIYRPRFAFLKGL